MQNPFTEKEMQLAYLFWLRHFKNSKTDAEVIPFLDVRIRTTSSASGVSWLKKARNAMYLSASTIAGRLNTTRANYSRLELNESDGSITLKNLAAAANAMDCELVYAIRPQEKKQFSEVIWSSVHPHVLDDPWLRNCDPRRRYAALAAVVNRKIKNTEFKRQQGWSMRLGEDPL